MDESLKSRVVTPSCRRALRRCGSAAEGSGDDQAQAFLGRGDLLGALQTLHRQRADFGTRSALRTATREFNLEDVAAALPLGAVFVSVMAGSTGGAALAMESGSTRVHCLTLPQLTADAVDALVAGVPGSSSRAVSLAEGYRRFSRRLGHRRLLLGDAWREWDRTLQGVLAGLGAIGWNRLHRWLRDSLRVPTGAEVVLSLPSALASLPVAAVHEPRSGRHFIDDFAARRIPDAGWLIRCEQKARALEREAPALLAVLDPAGDLDCDPDWPHKAWEIGRQRCEVLAGAGATPDCVTERLPDCTHYVHFGHGSRLRRHAVLELAAGPGTPPGKGELDDRRVRALKLTRNRLSILAACESGLRCGPKCSELNGMAGSFLLAGAACVIGCLWQVESTTTRRVVERTMSRHLGRGPGDKGLSPAQALRMAQLELRDSKVVAGSRIEGGAVLHLRPGNGGGHPAGTVCENHPYYWAGFSCMGG